MAPTRYGLGCALMMALSAVPLGWAHAQDYPSRSVKIVVPFTAGGTLDILARLLGQRLSTRLNQTFVVENKPGAGTALGANEVAKSPPDGYTLLLGSSTPLAINATLHKSLAYDPARDLVTVGLIAASPLALVVKPTITVGSVGEFVTYSKQHPEEWNYASSGVGSPHHLFMELFKTMTGAKAKHVPYRGTLPALNDLVGGHIHTMFTDLPPSLELLRSGRIRALALSSDRRVKVLPDLPTIAETGVPGYSAAAWLAVAVPAGVPQPILEKLFSEVKAFVALPETDEQFTKLGLTAMENKSLADIQTFVLAEIKRWGEVVKASGATVE